MGVGDIPEILLNSGHKMPLIGFGTVGTQRLTDDELASVYLEGIKAGYRHFDTAAIYYSEGPLGKAVAMALDQGLVKSRDELFITSKLWCNSADRELVLPALKQTLAKMRLDYVDLYLIHWPVRLKPETHGIIIPQENLLPFDIKGTWEGMEECNNLGLAKSIGVSNFSCHKLSLLLEHSTIPPAVNQVELNPAWHQKKILEFCKGKGINVSACSPLGANGGFWGSLAVVESPILKDIAQARGKSLAHIALRWIYEQGASIIVKSFNKERMRQNLEIFDWELSEEDLAQIQNIPQHKGYSGKSFISPNGQYKSFEDLWDGEI